MINNYVAQRVVFLCISFTGLVGMNSPFYVHSAPGSPSRLVSVSSPASAQMRDAARSSLLASCETACDVLCMSADSSLSARATGPFFYQYGQIDEIVFPHYWMDFSLSLRIRLRDGEPAFIDVVYNNKIVQVIALDSPGWIVFWDTTSYDFLCINTRAPGMLDMLKKAAVIRDFFVYVPSEKIITAPFTCMRVYTPVSPDDSSYRYTDVRRLNTRFYSPNIFG